MRQNKSIWLFGLMAFVLPAISYLLISWYEDNRQPLPVYGNKREVNGKSEVFRAGQFSFINQNGENTLRSVWDGKIVIANYFFTHCPVICPRMTANLKKVQETYMDDSRILLTSFSVDPVRDSAGQLRWYAAHFGIKREKWLLLTGDKKELYRYARNELLIVATDGDGGEEDFIHSENAVLLDRTGRLRGYYNMTSDEETRKLIKDIKRLRYEE